MTALVLGIAAGVVTVVVRVHAAGRRRKQDTAPANVVERLAKERATELQRTRGRC